MTASVSRLAGQPTRLGRLCWLPAGGYGDGLDDQAWAPVLRVSEQVLPQALEGLRAAGASAYAAWVRPPLHGPQDHVRKPGSYQLCAGASAYSRAGATLLAVTPRLAREAARRRDGAWR
ncbi:MAG TPA: hypothetical protein VMH35_25635 [Streptosporangiaceae bacterium]|nr:hypothetical protein [Streptosporangiaceae bacterium]